MSVLMIANMYINDRAWMQSYVENVPKIMAEYGGRTIARSTDVHQVEGYEGPLPDRVTILSFPSTEAGRSFLADPRYQPYHDQRLSGSSCDILMFENALEHGV